MRLSLGASLAALSALCGCGLLLDPDPSGQAQPDASPLDAAGDACPDGGCVPCPEVELRLTNTSDDEDSPHLIRVGSGFVIVWDGAVDGEGGAVARSITPAGAELWQSFLPDPARDPFVATDGTLVAVVSDGSSRTRYQYYDAASGTPVLDFDAGIGGLVVDDPYIVADSGGFASVWSEEVMAGDIQRLVFQTFDLGGGERSVPRTLTEGIYPPDEPQIAQLGDRYLVVWDDDGRPSSTGQWQTFRPGDSPTFGALGISADDPDVAANGSNFAVVYKEKGTTDDETIVFDLFDAGGVSRTTLALTGADGFRDEPAVAWSGEVWAVVFESGSGVMSDEDIELVTVSADGTTVLDGRPVSDGDGFAIEAAVAWSGIGWGVVWEDTRHGNVEIYYAHVCL